MNEHSIGRPPADRQVGSGAARATAAGPDRQASAAPAPHERSGVSTLPLDRAGASPPAPPARASKGRPMGALNHGWGNAPLSPGVNSRTLRQGLIVQARRQ